MLTKRARIKMERIVRTLTTKYRGIKSDYKYLQPDEYPAEIVEELHGLMEKMKVLRERLNEDDDERNGITECNSVI